jgi:hypothetical protein
MAIIPPPIKPTVRVTEIGEFVRNHSCERRFRLEANNRALARDLPFADRLFNPLDPVLQEVGRQRESDWEVSLQAAGLRDLTGYEARADDQKSTPWAELLAALGGVEGGQQAYGREIQVGAEFDNFIIDGRIDFVLLLWVDGRPVLRLVECKASRRDRTYHRIQVALYVMIVRQLLTAAPLLINGVRIDLDSVHAVVARIDDATNEVQSIIDLPRLDLTIETADIHRLLDDDGTLIHALSIPLNDLPFKLDAKCDTCVFHVNCLPESGRRRGLELLSLDPSTIGVLRHHGINDIDALAELDLAGPVAGQIGTNQSFLENLRSLQHKATARRRTLPGGDQHPDEYEVEQLPNSNFSQLPSLDSHGVPIVRVYISVDFDYAENRIGALAAHISNSDGQLQTGFVNNGGRWTPDPEVKERIRNGSNAFGVPSYQGEGPLQGEDIVEFKSSPWTGRLAEDSASERELIQSFFQHLVDAIADIANAPEAPIHFYVWSRSEMSRLVEACSRVSSQLLGHLRELLGCRESLEQLIYSCVQDEVERRYGLGWTGRGLSVISSLKWYGRRYHWVRRIAGTNVSLDWVFRQDIFDFKTDLQIRADGGWARNSAESASTHKFEIRTRFHDSLTAPYWRAYWRTLPDPDTVSPAVGNAIRRYNESAHPGYLREFLRARVHALRWVEQNIWPKNSDIQKPLITIANLPDFSLGVNNVARAALDFLRLEQHVAVNDWIAARIAPPSTRVPAGTTLPVRNVISDGTEISAELNLDAFQIDPATFETRSIFGEESFVRLCPCSEDSTRGQTIPQLTSGIGRTCIIESLDWQLGTIRLSVLPSQSTRYRLPSGPANTVADLFPFGTLDESVSDFVGEKVDSRLQTNLGTHVRLWFDPTNPQIPARPALDNASIENFETILTTMVLPGGHHLATDQVSACMDGLCSTVQLLQGPPGTGKTITTATATLLRVLARAVIGDVVLLCANTHTAVDTLLLRIRDILPAFTLATTTSGAHLSTLRIAKVHSRLPEIPTGNQIVDILPTQSTALRTNGIAIIGGTTSAVLKMASTLNQRAPFANTGGFQVPILVVDEASMMIFPHFLALSSLVRINGEIMLAGDHRQLAPITAHDWEREDRPPVVIYQPYTSAYDAVLRLREETNLPDTAIRRSALTFSFRLPPLVRDLIARLYRRDDIDLDGTPRATNAPANQIGTWESVWAGETGLFLVVHNERDSRKSNLLEATIIQRVLAASEPRPVGSVGIVTPHRAQRSLLRSRVGGTTSVDVIDTVERLQGGERPTIIVSATASEPTAISNAAEFILDLNRSNVAFSRAQDRLIVICSRTLLDHIPAEVETYDSALLWKSLREICSVEVGSADVENYHVTVLTPPITPA